MYKGFVFKIECPTFQPENRKKKEDITEQREELETDRHDHASAVIHNGIRCLVLLLGMEWKSVHMTLTSLDESSTTNMGIILKLHRKRHNLPPSGTRAVNRKLGLPSSSDIKNIAIPLCPPQSRRRSGH